MNMNSKKPKKEQAENEVSKDKFEEKQRLEKWQVGMLKAGLIEIIKSLDNEAISKVAKKVADSGAKEISLYMRGKYGIEEWISITRDRARMSGFSLKEHRGKDKTRLVMHHDMGENWSVFFKTYYETVFNDLGAKVSIDFTENAIMIELENSSL